MFAVYRNDGNGCTFDHDVVLFVTANEQIAEDAVSLATLECEEAIKVAQTFTNRHYRVTGEYDAGLKITHDALKAIFTVDVPEGPPEGNHALAWLYHVDENTYYFYQPVEVR